MTILCQLGKPRAAKPETLQEYGKLRDVMIQSPWVYLSDSAFIDRVCFNGTPFYGCVFDGHDLLTEANGQQKNCWRMQTLVGLDFDKCEVAPFDMVNAYAREGFDPWLAYRTFSDGQVQGHSYRLLWKVEPDLNVRYDDVRAFIKEFAKISGGHADKHAQDASRLWQGSNKGVVYNSVKSATLNLRSGLR